MCKLNLIVKEGQSSGWPTKVVIYTDGASRSNPGQASIGVFVLDHSEQSIYEEGSHLGIATNNEAEYQAVLRALKLAIENKVQKLFLKTDSQLVVKQIHGIYKIKSSHLKEIYLKCQECIKQIPSFEVQHVLRDENQKADELANRALNLLGY